MSPSRRGRRRAALGWTLLTFTVLALLLAWFSPEGSPYLTVAAYVPALLGGLPLALCLGLAFAARRRALAFLTLLAVPGWLWVAGFRASRPEPAPEGSLRLLTYNCRRAKRGWDEVASLIAREKPDLFCIQEANLGIETPLTPGYWTIRRGQFYIGSRWPIEDYEDVRPTRYLRGLAVQTHGLTFVGIHLRSFSARDDFAEDAILGLRGILKAARIQEEEVAHLHRQFRGRKRVILAGDTNLPPRGPAYRALTREYHDAWDDAGFGLGLTWHARYPVERIDRILAKGGRFHEIRVGPVLSSDHRSVAAVWSADRVRP